MKRWLLIQSLFLLVACGTNTSSISTIKPAYCTIITNASGSTISCPDGSSVVIPSQSTTMVQFCSNYTTSYPTSFPEFGICLSKVLYGVYWDGKNAWLAEIVPGYYQSTSNDAPCNFHVLTNCEVTP